MIADVPSSFRSRLLTPLILFCQLSCSVLFAQSNDEIEIRNLLVKFSEARRLDERLPFCTERNRINRIASILFRHVRQGRRDEVKKLIEAYGLKNLEIPETARPEMDLAYLEKLRADQEAFMDTLLKGIGEKLPEFAAQLHEIQFYKGFRPDLRMSELEISSEGKRATAILSYGDKYGTTESIAFEKVGDKWLFDGRPSDDYFTLNPTGIIEKKRAGLLD
jgi:hypothetical protein